MATRTKRPKQGYLPDLEPVTIREIDNAADAYVEVRDERCALSAEETKRREKLIELMRKHRLKIYEYEEKVVTFEHEDKAKIKVKPKKSVEENGDGEEE